MMHPEREWNIQVILSTPADPDDQHSFMLQICRINGKHTVL